MRRRCGAHDKSPLCFGSMWHVPALFFTPCCRVAWSIAYHPLTTYQNTILSSTHTPAPAVVHTTVHALCIHFQHHPHPHATSHSRNTEAGAVKYTNATTGTPRRPLRLFLAGTCTLHLHPSSSQTTAGQLSIPGAMAGWTIMSFMPTCRPTSICMS